MVNIDIINVESLQTVVTELLVHICYIKKIVCSCYGKWNHLNLLHTGHQQQPLKPLIRLRVEYTEENQMFNAVRFGLQYTDRVANPSDIVLFRKQRITGKTKTDGNFDKEILETLFNVEGVSLFSTHYTNCGVYVTLVAEWLSVVLVCLKLLSHHVEGLRKPQKFRVRMAVLRDMKPVFWLLHCMLH